MTGVATLLKSRWRHHSGEQLVLGIGGGSGSGKSTVAQLLSNGLRPLSVCVVNQDRFFKPPEVMPTYYSSYHKAPRPDFNHPDSFLRDQMIAFCQKVTGHDVVIVEGILALHFAELRSLMHMRCYVTIELEEMLRRRKARNLAAGYGGTAVEIDWYNLECVTPQHLRFNAPTAQHADLLIPNGEGHAEDRDDRVMQICSAVHSLRPTA